MVNKQITAWVGWIYFASTMLLIVGAIQVIAGLTGIFNSNFYVALESGRLVAFDYTTWGWIHLILGILAIASAIALAAGKLWAQIVALTFATLAVIANLASIGTYPLWSISALILYGFVIYAITVHGDEVRPV